MLRYYTNRMLRDLREYMKYPVWLIKKPTGPDNHVYKRRRIIKLTQKYGYKNFVETGTFYGQMIHALKSNFDKILSVELFPQLYEVNKKAFINNKKIKIFNGDSSKKLSEMIQEAGDNIIFWLDGHYSGQGTGMGEQTSPVLDELEIINLGNLSKYCILIDDYRLFNGADGYPTVVQVFEKVKQMNSQVEIYIDKDCFVIVSQKNKN